MGRVKVVVLAALVAAGVAAVAVAGSTQALGPDEWRLRIEIAPSRAVPADVTPSRRRAVQHPSLTRPQASPDSFSVSGTTLTVAAPGVLGNDTITTGAVISSYGATGTEQTTIGSATPTSQGGSVRLNADGGFTYAAANGFSGSDTFSYVLGNGAGTSTAAVTLVVEAPPTTEYTVTSPGFFYSFSGLAGENPVLTLKRGLTYTFHISTSSIHPFEIQGAPPGSVTNNNTSSGTITFAVPTTATNYAYHCSIHDFGNSITTVP